jgi:hypothetical protein
MLGAVLFLIPGAATAHAEELRTFKVWDWNITGNVWHHGSTTDGIVQAAVDSIIDNDADFASFNEICGDQYQAIQSLLASRGWPATNDYSRFAATRVAEDGICHGTDAFGQALFSRNDLGTSRQYELPWDGKKGTKKLLCAPLAANSLMKFCTVHITTQTVPLPGQTVDPKTQQLNHVLGLLDGFHAAGETYIIAGDFNAQPHYDRLNGYYAPSANTAYNGNNTGAHRELDDADPNNCPGYGAWTADAEPPTLSPCGGYWKVDSIFVRESRKSGSYSADALPIPTSCTGLDQCSDHRIIVGTVTLRLP